MIKTVLLFSLNLFSAFGLAAANFIIDAPKVLAISTLDISDADNLQMTLIFRDALKAHVDKDYQSAFNNFTKMAHLNGGSAEGMYFLGLYYIEGRGTKKSIKLGVAYLDAASRAQYARASSTLMWIYLNSQLVTPDIDKALEYLHRMPDGNTECFFEAGEAILISATDAIEQVAGILLLVATAKAGHKRAQMLVEKYDLEAFLAKIMIESNLHEDLRYFNGSEQPTMDYKMAKAVFSSPSSISR